MIIDETEECWDIHLSVGTDKRLWIESDCELIVIDREQAVKLISALQLYVDDKFKNDESE